MNRFYLIAFILFILSLSLFPNKIVASADDFYSVEKYVNVVENSGFEEVLEGWELRVGRGAEIVVDPGVSLSGNPRLRIKRTDYGYGYARQRLYFGNRTAKNFLLSGWARSEFVTAKYHFFDLLAVPVYEDGSSEWSHVEFSHGTHDWEFKSLALSLNESKRVDNITIYVRFQDESGTAWFDDISFVWVDANVQVKCVDESSANLVNALVRVYSGLELLGERYTGENGTVDFLLSANDTYSFLVYWKGVVVERKDDVEVLEDVNLVFTCDVSFETVPFSLFLRDFFGQTLPNKAVEARFRPLTSTEDFLTEELRTDSDGKVECSLLVGPGEIRVSLASSGAIYEARKMLDVGSNSSVELRFDFVKLGGMILSVDDFILYSIVAVFLSVTFVLICYDIYGWKRHRRN